MSVRASSKSLAADLPGPQPFTREVAADVRVVRVCGDDHADPPQARLAQPV